MKHGRSPSGTSSERGSAGCPHVNRNDARCATRFCLGRIEQAFSVCFGAYHGCPMYHRINAEAVRPDEAAALVTLTISA